MSSQHTHLPEQEVSFLVRNGSSRAAHLVFDYAQTNSEAGWTLDRSGPPGLGQDLGEVRAKGVKTVVFRMTERLVPWRVHVMVYERANVLEKAKVALERMYAKLRLGADAGRGPHLVDDSFLEGCVVVSQPIVPKADQARSDAPLGQSGGSGKY